MEEKSKINNLKINKVIENTSLQKEPILEGELTGYPSIDKPWNRFYRDIPMMNIDTNQTIYNMVFNANKDNMDAVALGYLGVNWTFKKLKGKVDQAADAFFNMGIKMNDVVLVGVSNSPESVVTLLALNKIGAVSKWFDVRAGEKDIEDYANDSNCKCLVAFDLLIPRVQLIIDNTKLSKVVIINPTNSLPKVVQELNNAKTKKEGTYVKLPNDDRYIRYNEFMKLGSKKSDIKCVPFDKDRASIMIQSSGTTGKPKTIVHSDLSCTSCVNKIAYSDLPLGRGKSLLVALPPWIAYGLGDAIVLPLVFGTKVELSPTFTPDSVFKNVGKFTIAFAAPFNYRYLRDNFNLLTNKQKKEFEKVECLVSGGDKISVEENKEFEELFDAKLVNGYGNNEGWGALTVNPTKYNKYGTVGIPKYGETIISYDNDNQKELKYGEIGEICSLSDTMFLRYEGNIDETNKVKKVHEDGNIWLHTGDLGYVDKDGFITLGGRTRRVIVRLAFKISAYTIEDKICEHPAVKECVAVGVKDEVEEQTPMAYIVLRDEFKGNEELIEKDIYSKCTSELKGYEIPKYFRIVDKLPYTQNGKYDFRLLEQQGNEFVDNIQVNQNDKKLTL